jgi:small-conductance mechanosensitive channel
VNGGTAAKLALTLAAVAAIAIAGAALNALAVRAFTGPGRGRPRFWSTQAVHVAVLAAILLVVARLWFPSAGSLGPALGWIGAGVAVALQRVITAFAGYLILLRGQVFTVGDRITIGGVRGDVVSLGFMQTTVMEMGQTPAEKDDDPAMWIRGRQYSGRVVRVTNDRIFDTPVYNFTRGFPYLWDEIAIPVRYGDDHARVERIMLDAARRHTRDIIEGARPLLPEVSRKYFIADDPALEPRVYLRMTDNWIELAVRYFARARGNRELSDAINREILREMEAAKLQVASATYEITGIPAVRIEADPSS